MRNTQRYMSLPFNPKLKERAKALRKAGMLHEALLWNQLKRKQCNGLDFDRQKIIGNYIVDFFCAEKAVIIEADGASHEGREDYDAERDAYLLGLGLTVIRIDVKEILQNMEGVVAFLKNHPALQTNTTPPCEHQPPRPAGTPPKEGNILALNFSPEPMCGTVLNSPPPEGWQAQPDGVVNTGSQYQQIKEDPYV